jgi:hypothetical protein
MEYELIDILPGFFALIHIVISLLVAFKISLKYLEYKNKIFLYMGVSWTGMALPWLTDAINTIMILSINTVLNPYAKVIIEIAILPYFFTIWLAGFTELMYKKKQKTNIIICLIISILIDIILIIIMFTNFSLIGTMVSSVAIVYSIYITIYLLVLMLLFLITGIIFGLETRKSDIPDIKLRGNFIIAAFISFTIAALLDVIAPVDLIWLILSRAILVLCSIEYYFGFFYRKKTN